MQTSEQEHIAVKQYPSLPHFNPTHRHSLHFKTDPSKHRMTLYSSQFLPLSSSTLVTQTHLCWPYQPCPKIPQWVTIAVMENAGAGTWSSSDQRGQQQVPSSQHGALSHTGKVTCAGDTCRVFADSLSGLLVHTGQPSQPNHSPERCCSLTAWTAIHCKQQIWGAQHWLSLCWHWWPKSTCTHVEKPCLQLWLRQI